MSNFLAVFLLSIMTTITPPVETDVENYEQPATNEISNITASEDKVESINNFTDYSNVVLDVAKINRNTIIIVSFVVYLSTVILLAFIRRLHKKMLSQINGLLE